MVKCAEQSPRVCEDGVIRWYVGDTFVLTFDLVFTTEENKIIEPKETDKITICFKDAVGRLIYETEVIGKHTLDVTIDEETTKKFKVGKYSYCVKRCSSFTTTIMRLNEVIVE